jgi:hypothetical protein
MAAVDAAVLLVQVVGIQPDQLRPGTHRPEAGELGDAELATDKPRRFRRAAKPAVAAPGADDAGSAADSTELAGAA